MRKIICILVLCALVSTSLNGWAVDTVTFHGSDVSRQGYYPVDDNIPIELNEQMEYITTDALFTPSPVTALIKRKTTGNEWWDDEQVENCPQRIAVCAENVLTVYEPYFSYGDDELRYKWTYTFNSPVVATPITLTLEPCNLLAAANHHVLQR